MADLTTVTQVQWPRQQCSNGAFIRLRMNRPGTKTFAVAATDMLTLDFSRGGIVAPRQLEGMLLSQKYLTNEGRDALDAINIKLLDSWSYTGSINGVAITENLMTGTTNGTANAAYSGKTPSSFLGTWFNVKGTAYLPNPYWVWIEYWSSSGAYTIEFIGSYDALSKPQSAQQLFFPESSAEVILTSRSIQIVSIEDAMNSTIWSDVLALMDHGGAGIVQGEFYNGFEQVSQDCVDNNTHNGVFDTGISFNPWLDQSVMYIRYGGRDGNAPNLRSINSYGLAEREIITGFSNNPWPSQRGETNWTYNGLTSPSIANGGANYVAGNTFTVDGGNPDAVGVVDSVDPTTGAVLTFHFSSPGQGYAPSNNATTTQSTSGIGSGLEILINLLNSWGPWGTWGIRLVNLIDYCCQAMGWDTFSASDIAAALEARMQIADSSRKCFPVGPRVTVENYWVSLNWLTGSHPWDGNQSLVPGSISPNSPIAGLLTGIGAFLLADRVMTINQTSGLPHLSFRPFGAFVADRPKKWKNGKLAREEPPAVNAVAVSFQNMSDSLMMQAPQLKAVSQGRGSMLPFSSYFRMRRIAQAVYQADESTTLDYEALMGLDEGESDQAGVLTCAKVVNIEQSGVTNVFQDWWKLLTGVYIYSTDARVPELMYASPIWNPFDFNNPTSSPNGDGFGSGDYTKGSFLTLGAQYAPYRALASSSSILAAGTGYAVGDTFSIDGGTTDAVGIVDSIGSSGSVTAFHLRSAGVDYSDDGNTPPGPNAFTATTTALTGSGAGLTISAAILVRGPSQPTGDATFGLVFNANGVTSVWGYTVPYYENNYARFNSITYNAVVTAFYKLPGTTVIRRSYIGNEADDSSLMSVAPGFTDRFWYDGAMRIWIANTIQRDPINDSTIAVVYSEQANSGDFPDIDAMPYGPVGSAGTMTGTSSTYTGGTGGGAGTNTSTWKPDLPILLTGAGVLAPTSRDVYYICKDSTTTGLTAPATAKMGETLVITNKTGADWISPNGDFYIANNDTWLLVYDGQTSKSDPSLPAGWNIMGRSS